MRVILFYFVIIFFINRGAAQQLPVSTTLNDFFMPGSQPGESGDLTKPTSCNCHDFNKGYIYDKWQGSMMAHAVVDSL